MILSTGSVIFSEHKCEATGPGLGHRPIGSPCTRTNDFENKQCLTQQTCLLRPKRHIKFSFFTHIFFCYLQSLYFTTFSLTNLFLKREKHEFINEKLN